MATQITHIVTAEKMYDAFFSDHNKKVFFVGTVFPDIRYLGDISREATHVANITLEALHNETNSFRAGILFHSLIDRVREEYIEQSGIYDWFDCDFNKPAVVKLLEDEVLYRHVPNWQEFMSYFDSTLPEEEAMGVPKSSIEAWHANLRAYFATSPTDETRVAYAQGLRIPEEKIVTINQALATLREQPQAIAIANGFYDNLETLILN